MPYGAQTESANRTGHGIQLATLLAWGVHAYTALGLVCAAAVAIGIVRGDERGFHSAFWWLLIAMVIDSTDGWMARKVGVSKVLPQFDGRRLDDLTDFLNYTFLPLLLAWRAGLAPVGMEAWLLVPLLASAYGFCQAEIKTADGFFLGFPSLWNVAVFYLYELDAPGWLALTVLLVFALLTFVPSLYLYPSRPGRLNRLATLLGALWAVCVAWLVIRTESLGRAHTSGEWTPERTLLWLSLAYPAFYLASSWWITLERWTHGTARVPHAVEASSDTFA